MTYARMGRRDDALKIIRDVEALEHRQWVEPTFLAIGYAALGDADHTMQWLQTSTFKT